MGERSGGEGGLGEGGLVATRLGFGEECGSRGKMSERFISDSRVLTPNPSDFKSELSNRTERRTEWRRTVKLF